MLIEFVDTRGKSIWISAMHVKAVREKKPGVTEIFIIPPTMGASPIVRVDARASDIASKINAAMPDLAHLLAPLDDSGPSADGATQTFGAM